MTSVATPRFLATPLRIAIAAVCVLACGLFALTLYVGREANRTLSERTLSALSSEVVILRRARDQGGTDALRATIQDRMRASPEGLYRLTTADGRVIAGNFTPDTALDSAGGIFTFKSPGQLSAPSRHAAGLVVATGDGGQLAVARDIEDQHVLANTLRRATLVAAGALSLIGLSFGWLLSRNFNARVAGINAASAAIMSGELSRRLPQDGSGDELDALAASLNGMLTRIEELMAALREVSDNIAHDLKTPLTRLRNRAEAALRDPSGAPAFRDGLERTIEEADGLIQTFNALLLIARLEAGAVEDTKMETDLSSLVSDVVELYQPVADEADLTISLNNAAPVKALVNRQLFGQAVANLIDNAIKYSRGTQKNAADRTITVAITTNAEGAPEIAVGDHGPGIPEIDRGRVLKRFVRLERSRSQPGTGLGLSLVAAVARLHDGTIRLEDNAPGLLVVMSLRGVGRPSHS